MNSIINLHDYTVLEHVFFAIGCLLWVFTYFIVIHNIRKHKVIEIPVIAVCSNFCWEILWSFVFKTDMGSLYVWGYRAWFFLDCYIVYGMFKYGYKQMGIEQFRNHFKVIITAVFICWVPLLYNFIKIYDFPITHMGANSGFLINVMMSALYIPLLARSQSLIGMSFVSGVLKGLGTLLISVFCFMRFDDPCLLSMCVVTGILDLAYIILFAYRKKHPLLILEDDFEPAQAV